MRPVATWLGVVVAGASLQGTARASEEPTWWMFEGVAGAASPAYEGGTTGVVAGVAIGPTFRPGPSSMRFHLLGNVHMQHFGGQGPVGGPRTDLSVFGALRAVFPVWTPLRVYLEGGFGMRHEQRGLPSGTMVRGTDAMYVFGVGAQLRLDRSFTIGLRAAYEPSLGPNAADLGREPLGRASALLTTGVQF